MKKTILMAILSLTSVSAFADHCAKFENNERYTKAIIAVATAQERTYEEFCNRPALLEIEAQPSRIINKKGEIVPHVRVQQHFSYDSCSYLVNETDYSITETRCYSGF